MSVERQVAQQFVNFLVDRITTKSQKIRQETQGETTKFHAEELNLHCEELQKAIGTLFGNLDASLPLEPPIPELQPAPPASRKGRSNQ